MANSSITAFCASKNVLCVHKDRHTLLKYFVALGLRHRSHKGCWADQAKIRKSNENPCSGESRLGVKEKRHCWISHLRRALQLLISATQQTHQDRRFDIISRGGRTAGHGEVYSIMWNMNLRVTLSHWKTKPSDNSSQFGPRPRTPAQFYKQVFHSHMLTGSSCTKRLWAQIRHNTEMPICEHDVPVPEQVSFCIKTKQKKKSKKGENPTSTSFLSYWSVLI